MRRAAALVAFAACCFGSISVLAVLGTREGLSVAALLAWRYALAAAVLLALVLHGGAARGSGRDALVGLVVGGAGQALVGWLTLTALRWIPAATLGFLFYTYPGWITLIAAARRTESVGRPQAAALALSFTGIVLTVGVPGAGVQGATARDASAWPGVLLALGAAVLYAVYVPFLHRLEARTSGAAASAYVSGGAGLACLVAALAGGSLTLALTPAAWGIVLALALGCTVVAFLAFMRGLASLGPVRTSIVATVEPFWTAVLGAAVLAQPLAPSTVGGGVLIAAAVLVLQRDAARRR